MKYQTKAYAKPKCYILVSTGTCQKINVEYINESVTISMNLLQAMMTTAPLGSHLQIGQVFFFIIIYVTI